MNFGARGGQPLSRSSDNSAGTFDPLAKEIQIEVRDFGPIANAVVDLRPLTVFVGPSNTGKTYLSILVYALHQELGGFQRLPKPSALGFPYDLSRPDRGLRASADGGVSENEFMDVYKKLHTDGRSFMFADLPATVRENLQAVLQDSDTLGRDIKRILEYYFDAPTSELIRAAGGGDTKVSLRVHEQDRDLWRFSMDVTQQQVTVEGQIENMVLLPPRDLAVDSSLSRRIGRIARTTGSSLFQELAEIASSGGGRASGKIHYLPAARSGIMLSHRVIASSLMARSTRAGLERFPEVSFSGLIAEFMQQLLLYDASKAPVEVMNELANALENETLGGMIGTGRSPGGYPEFGYRPRGTNEDVRLSRVSSMVSELAPVVLFLRGVVGIGDTLIIEEPEAHLHPAAQTRMAVTLGRLVRAGVRVLITTHSDWLLKEIANLMREGELAEQTDEHSNEASLPSSLRPSDVGVWLFRQDVTVPGSTVQEIRFDRSEGVEPAEYDDVAEELYNRSADLQNKLEEVGSEE